MSSIHIPAFLLSIPRNPVTAIGLPLAFGLLSGMPTARVVRGEWYNSLRTPPGRPPRQVFPVVWPVLYICMGYASHLAVKALDLDLGTTMSSSDRDNLILGLALYYVQLGMNLIWSPLFFGMKKVGLALIDSILLTGTTIYMTKLLDGPTNSETTYLLLPYCAWLSFATYLNGGIWLLNRSRTRTIPKQD